MAGEIAATAVGIIAYVEPCVKGYRFVSGLLSDMRNFGEVAAELEAHAIVEENRFLIWGRIHNLVIRESDHTSTGIRDYLLLPAMTESVIKILVNVSKEQNKLQRIAQSYSLDVEPKDINGDMEAAHTRFLVTQTVNPAGIENVTCDLRERETRSKTLKAPQTGSFKKRLRWAMGDKAALNDCLTALAEHNEALYNLTIPSLQVLAYEALVSSIPVRNPLMSLEARVAALEAYRGIVSNYPRAREELDALASRWRHDAKKDEELSKVHQLDISAFQGSLPRVPDNAPARNRCLAKLYTRPGDRQVLVEWKSYDPNSISTEEVKARVGGIVSLLDTAPQDAAYLLRSAGYFEDTRPSNSTARAWVGIVYELPPPPPNGPLRPHLSLKDLMENFDTPPLGQRFRLAAHLSEMLLCINNCGWLHKGLRPENIIFFSGPEIDVQHPYVLGWEYSRKNLDEEKTESVFSSNANAELYQHPDHLMRKRYRQEFDQYQLGCMLLEIAIWEPLVDIRRRMDSRLKPGEWRTMLVQQAEKLKKRMGQIYSGVVVRLLQGLNSESKIGYFWEDVVLELQKCNA